MVAAFVFGFLLLCAGVVAFIVAFISYDDSLSYAALIIGVAMTIFGGLLFGGAGACLEDENNTETKQDHDCIVESDYNYCPNCGFELKGEIE